MMKLTYSTGTFADNTENGIPGAAFALLLHANGKTAVKSSNYDKDGSYLTVWMAGIANQLEQLSAAVAEVDDKAGQLHLTITYWHTNIHKMISKVYSVYEDTKSLVELNPKLLNIKLRRANKQHYAYHNDMVRIINALRLLNESCDFRATFTQRAPKGEFGLAQQQAQLLVEEQ